VALRRRRGSTATLPRRTLCWPRRSEAPRPETGAGPSSRSPRAGRRPRPGTGPRWPWSRRRRVTVTPGRGRHGSVLWLRWRAWWWWWPRLRGTRGGSRGLPWGSRGWWLLWMGWARSEDWRRSPFLARTCTARVKTGEWMADGCLQKGRLAIRLLSFCGLVGCGKLLSSCHYLCRSSGRALRMHIRHELSDAEEFVLAVAGPCMDHGSMTDAHERKTKKKQNSQGWDHGRARTSRPFTK